MPSKFIEVKCLGCGMHFQKRGSDIRRTNKNFHSKKCRGEYLSRIHISEFNKSCKKVGDCLVWTGSRNKDGYGTTKYMGRSITAHRMSYLLCNAEIPTGMHVLHKCDNPPCVNAEHLYLGTHRENMADMARKGRGNGSPGRPKKRNSPTTPRPAERRY